MKSILATCGRAAALALAAGSAWSVIAQDSVALTPGGNDALSAYASSAQTVRYVVDLVDATTSWGNSVAVAPLFKASRDLDPLFRTQILGAAAISADTVAPVSFPSRQYEVWSVAGDGVGPDNQNPSTTNITGYDEQFGVGAGDLSLAPTNILGGVVGRNASDLSRLYVSRVVALCSRPSAGGTDHANLSLGGVTPIGAVYVRGDDFGAAGASAIHGENIVRVRTDLRGSSPNQIFNPSGANIAADPSATRFLINDGVTTVNTPVAVTQVAQDSLGAALDFTGVLTTEGSGGTSATTTDHIAPGVAGLRGNPTLARVAAGLGSAATCAALAVTDEDGYVSAINVWGLDFGAMSGDPMVVTSSSAAAYTMPAPITAPGGFSANASADAEFAHYRGQVCLRGGSGQVGVGQTNAGDLVLAATATDRHAGEFIAVATVTGSVASWSVAAHEGQSVLDESGGSTVGALISDPIAAMSSPAIDMLGNVYFVARWQPTLGAPATGLFKSHAGSHELELLLTTGQTIHGANSNTDYTVEAITLADADSIASGAFHAGHVLQRQAQCHATTDADSVFAFGGAIVNATIRYERGANDETYDAVLFVAPSTDADALTGDINGDCIVNTADLGLLISGFGTGAFGPDINNDCIVNTADLGLLIANFGQMCP